MFILQNNGDNAFLLCHLYPISIFSQPLHPTMRHMPFNALPSFPPSAGNTLETLLKPTVSYLLESRCHSKNGNRTPTGRQQSEGNTNARRIQNYKKVHQVEKK